MHIATPLVASEPTAWIPVVCSGTVTGFSLSFVGTEKLERERGGGLLDDIF